jgi:hypothetical protein
MRAIIRSSSPAVKPKLRNRSPSVRQDLHSAASNVRPHFGHRTCWAVTGYGTQALLLMLVCDTLARHGDPMSKGPVLNYSSQCASAASPAGAYAFGAIELCAAYFSLVAGSFEHEPVHITIACISAIATAVHGVALLAHRKTPARLMRDLTVLALSAQSVLAYAAWSMLRRADRIADPLGRGMVSFQAQAAIAAALFCMFCCICGALCARRPEVSRSE